jgi:hypothetical protein
MTFDILLREGAFGSPYDLPESLRGADIQFRFETPLHDAVDAQKGNKFMEMKALLAEAAALDPTALAIPDFKEAMRDTLEGIKVPAKWINSKEVVDQKIADQQNLQQMAQELAGMEQGGKGLASLAKANKDFAETG